MVSGYKDDNGKFHPIRPYQKISPTRKKRLSEHEHPPAEIGVMINKSKHNEGLRLKRNKIEAIELHTRELRDHPLFEESTEWLDVFAESPRVIVADDRRGIFYIWFGGESHYVHEYTPDGHEFDVFSFGFEKNKLDPEEVVTMIEKRLNEPVDEE